MAIDAEAAAAAAEAAASDAIEERDVGESDVIDAERPSVQDLWRHESFEIAEHRRAAAELAELEARFDTLRIELEAAFHRRIRVAVDQMQITFDHEIEALRTLNREEAKRIRSTNDEAFVRIRVSNTAELERIRAAIDEGVARLCTVLEGQLDRVWAANDVELDRIRSAGADRLSEVHDLLTHQLDRLREEQMAGAPAPEPSVPPDDAIAGEHATVARRWLRRRRTPAAH